MTWRYALLASGLILLILREAIANDGFYMGSGATVVPVRDTRLRVLKEELVIKPIIKRVCYEVLYQGHVLVNRDPSKTPARYVQFDFPKWLKDREFGSIGRKIDF